MKVTDAEYTVRVADIVAYSCNSDTDTLENSAFDSTKEETYISSSCLRLAVINQMHHLRFQFMAHIFIEMC